MMRNAALIVCVTALLAACATAPEGVTARSQLPGKWDWEKSEPRCGDAAGAFSFSPDGRQVRVNDVVYEVLADEGKTMRLRAVGETRKTDAGVPVEWNLLMLNADTFCWRRTDWKAGACTALLQRCPGP
jgi:hypothetical protein